MIIARNKKVSSLLGLSMFAYALTACEPPTGADSPVTESYSVGLNPLKLQSMSSYSLDEAKNQLASFVASPLQQFKLGETGTVMNIESRSRFYLTGELIGKIKVKDGSQLVANCLREKTAILQVEPLYTAGCGYMFRYRNDKDQNEYQKTTAMLRLIPIGKKKNDDYFYKIVLTEHESILNAEMKPILPERIEEIEFESYVNAPGKIPDGLSTIEYPVLAAADLAAAKSNFDFLDPNVERIELNSGASLNIENRSEFSISGNSLGKLKTQDGQVHVSDCMRTKRSLMAGESLYTAGCGYNFKYLNSNQEVEYQQSSVKVSVVPSRSGPEEVKLKITITEQELILDSNLKVVRESFPDIQNFERILKTKWTPKVLSLDLNTYARVTTPEKGVVMIKKSGELGCAGISCVVGRQWNFTFDSKTVPYDYSSCSSGVLYWKKHYRASQGGLPGPSSHSSSTNDIDCSNLSFKAVSPVNMLNLGLEAARSHYPTGLIARIQDVWVKNTDGEHVLLKRNDRVETLDGTRGVVRDIFADNSILIQLSSGNVVGRVEYSKDVRVLGGAQSIQANRSN